MSKCKVWLALAVAAQLAACGGGGGGADSAPIVSAPPPVVSPPVTTPPVTTPPPSDGNIVVTVPPPTYPAASGNLLVYSTINALRSKIGSGLLAQSAQLDKSADAHWNYISLNGIGELHGETAGKPGFTGARAADRIAAAGYKAAVSGEAIYSTGSGDKFATCVAEWANSVYHAALLFSSSIDIGVSSGNLKTDPAATLCVVDIATSATATAQLPAAGSIRAYPYADQIAVPFVFLNRTEMPTAAPDLAELGTPVTVNFETKGLAITAAVAISQFTLTPTGGSPVDARILVNKGGKLGPVISSNGPALTDDSQMQGFAATLIPVKRLQPNTAYKVSLIAVVDGKTIDKSWTFTTAAQ
jgi:uncharacterized protein YkwD